MEGVGSVSLRAANRAIVRPGRVQNLFEFLSDEPVHSARFNVQWLACTAASPPPSSRARLYVADLVHALI